MKSVSYTPPSNENTGSQLRELDGVEETSKTQLTGFAEGEVTQSVASEDVASTPLFVSANPFPNQGLGIILSRMYQIGTYSWASTDSAWSNLAVMSFPKLLFDQIQIARQMEFFSYFRCKGIKLQFRINASPRHYGLLAVTNIPGALVGTSSTQIGWRGKRNNDPHFVSALQNTTLEMELPWLIPMPLLTLPLSSTYEKVLYEVALSVAVPLRAVATTVPNVEVFVTAAFIEPELFGPNPLTTMPTSGPAPLDYERVFDVDLELAERLREDVVLTSGGPKKKKNGKTRTKESKEKATDHSMLSDISDFIQGTVTTVSDVADTISKLAPLAALLDKPTVLDVPAKVRQSYSMGMAQVEGADDVTPFSLYADSRVSMESTVVGNEDPTQPVSKFVSTPGYLRSFSVASTATAGSLVDQWYVDPVDCPERASGIGTHYIQPTYLSYLTHISRYWRGSIRYSFIIVASTFTSMRLKVTFVPRFTGTYVSGTSTYFGDVPSKIIDVNGDTSCTIEVPYIFDRYWCQSGSMFSTSADNPGLHTTGKIIVEVLTQMTKSDATEPTQYAECLVYVSGGPDFQLAGIFGADDAAGTVALNTNTIIATSSIEELTAGNVIQLDDYDKVIEEKYNMADNFVSVTQTMNRYSQAVAYATAPALQVRHPPYLPSSNALSLFQYLLYPYRFYRGALRYRVFLDDDFTGVKQVYLDNATDLGGIFNGGYMEEVGPNARMLGIEMPYYFPLPAVFREHENGVGTNLGPSYKALLANTTIVTPFNFRLLMAAGDDFIPMCLRTPPMFTHNIT